MPGIGAPDEMSAASSAKLTGYGGASSFATGVGLLGMNRLAGVSLLDLGDEKHQHLCLASSAPQVESRKWWAPCHHSPLTGSGPASRLFRRLVRLLT